METITNKSDLSKSLRLKLFPPISEINDETKDLVIEWLKDKNSLLSWFNSIVTGSTVLLTIFGNKPNFHNANGVMLTLSLILMFMSVLLNLVCIWQIPKWKYAINSGHVADGKYMTRDIELTSWAGVGVFLLALVLAVLGNLPFDISLQ